MMKRVFLGIVAVAALILLIFYSQIRVSPPFVSGVVETDEIRLGSRVAGRVKKVLVKEGDRITTGMPLIEFEPYDLLEREQTAEAELAMRAADLKRLETGLRAEDIARAKARVDQLAAQLKLLEKGPRAEEIDAAQERLKSAEAQRLLAKGEYDRRARLVQSNAISQSELEVARQQLDASVADVQVKKNELAILKAGARQEEIDQAKAKVEEARLGWELARKGFRTEEIEQAQAARDAGAARLRAIRQQKSELTINAPAEGIVDALDLQTGDLVAPNAPVMTVLADQNMWVRAYVPQRFLQLKIGQKLPVTIDGFPGKEFLGTISFISNQAEFTPSNVQTTDDRAKQVYRIRITINETGQKLRAGMTANVWLDPADGGNSK